MTCSNPLHLPMAGTLVLGPIPGSARLARSPPPVPVPHLFPIDVTTLSV